MPTVRAVGVPTPELTAHGDRMVTRRTLTRLSFALLATFFAVWALGFAAFKLPLGTLALTLAVGAYALGCRRPSLRAFVAGTGIVVMASPVSLWEYVERVDALSARLGQGPAAFSTWDKVGIAGLNVAMAGVGAAVGFPEAALETTLLFVPGPDTRHFRSDFPMRSPMVQRAVCDALRRERSRRHRVVWSYPAADDSMRVALALHPFDLRLTPVEEAGRRGVRAQGTIAVTYPTRYRLHLFSVPTPHGSRSVGIEEGLYGMLQDAGWMHPYDAEWTWTVWEDSDACTAD